MMWSSDGAEGTSDKGGYTLLETLVVLSVMATVLGVSAVAIRQTPTSLANQSELASFQEHFSQARLEAMRTGEATNVDTADLCEYGEKITIFADGTAKGGPLCLAMGVVELNPLAGTWTPRS